jgi:hypothetical protein
VCRVAVRLLADHESSAELRILIGTHAVSEQSSPEGGVVARAATSPDCMVPAAFPCDCSPASRPASRRPDVKQQQDSGMSTTAQRCQETISNGHCGTPTCSTPSATGSRSSEVGGGSSRHVAGRESGWIGILTGTDRFTARRPASQVPPSRSQPGYVAPVPAAVRGAVHAAVVSRPQLVSDDERVGSQAGRSVNPRAGLVPALSGPITTTRAGWRPGPAWSVLARPVSLPGQVANPASRSKP